MKKNPPAPTARPLQVSSLNERKLQHLQTCQDESVDLNSDSFACYKLRYNALPEIAIEDVSSETEFAGKKIAAPLIISCMTGGVGRSFRDINHNLARGAAELNVPLGVGSMKVLLNHREAEESFQIRKVAPSVSLIANLGLVSFNYGLEYSDVARIIDLIRPDVFGIHLNALQEAIQEGGDTNFRGLTARLEELTRRCPLPIYVKECGGGIAPGLVYRLAEIGVSYVDISGRDGTSWAAVEGQLSRDPSLGELFRDFGLPTAWILKNLSREKVGRIRVVAGGGIRNGIQAAKALALGAQYVSVAKLFLLAATESAEAVVETGCRLIRELRTAMFLVGARNVDQLDRSLLMEDVGQSRP
ncbi:MAG: type 2 isopentenyl-diphosphate Delta-isomerase [Acidobacteriota bacterium]